MIRAGNQGVALDGDNSQSIDPSQDKSPGVSKTSVFVFFLATAAFLWRATWVAENAVSPFRPIPWDGTFQLLNSIRRLLAGYSLGNDYVVFHGPLWQLLHVPGFVLSSESLLALEASKYLINTALPPIIAGLIVVLALPQSRYRWWLGTGNLLAVGYLSNEVFLAELSSLGQRASVSLLVIGALWSSFRASKVIWMITFSAFAGACIALSIDQGVYAFVAVLTTVCFVIVVQKRTTRSWQGLGDTVTTAIDLQERWRPQRYLVGMAIALITLALATYLAAGSSLTNMVQAFQFYFSDLPSDQRWYFGTWPQFSIESFTDLPKYHLRLMLLLGLSVLLGVSAVQSILRATADKRRPKLLDGVILSLAIYSILSCWTYIGGMASESYLQPPTFALVTGLFLLVSEKLPNNSFNGGSADRRFEAFSLALLFSALPVLFIALPLLAANSERAAYDARWTEYETFMEENGVTCDSNTDLWSTYPSLVQFRNGCFGSAGDLFIHALGSNRNDYVETFVEVKPLWVETARGDDLLWESWLRSTSWPFYSHLWTWYRPVLFTDHSIVWYRRDEPDTWLGSPIQSQRTQLSDEGIAVFDAPEYANWIGVASVKYSANRPLEWLPVIGKQSLFTINLIGTRPSGEQVTLRPDTMIQKFPVLWDGVADSIVFDFRKKGLNPLDSLTIFDVTISWFEQPQDPIAGWPVVFGEAW